MKTKRLPPTLRCLCIALLGGASFISTTHGQTAPAATPDAATLAKYDKNKNGRLDADELATLRADEEKAAKAAAAAAKAQAKASANANAAATRSDVVEKPKANIYTAMLAISFVAIVIGCVCLYLEWNVYR